jgi:hypothetical protein
MIGYKFYYHNGEGMNEAHFLKRVVYSAWIVLVFFVGVFGLKDAIGWLKIFWVIIYAAGVLLLGIALIIELSVGLSFNILSMVASLRLFYCTPLPFMAMLAIEHIYARQLS